MLSILGFIQMRWNVNEQRFTNEVIAFNAASVLILEYQKCQENQFQKI